MFVFPLQHASRSSLYEGQGPYEEQGQIFLSIANVFVIYVLHKWYAFD